VNRRCGAASFVSKAFTLCGRNTPVRARNVLIQLGRAAVAHDLPCLTGSIFCFRGHNDENLPRGGDWPRRLWLGGDTVGQRDADHHHLDHGCQDQWML
jgi:hypothetical protein